MYDKLKRAAEIFDRSTNDGCQRIAVLLLGWSRAFKRSELEKLTNECVRQRNVQPPAVPSEDGDGSTCVTQREEWVRDVFCGCCPGLAAALSWSTTE